jgi:mycothiol synthase
MSKVIGRVPANENQSHAADEYLQMVWPRQRLQQPPTVTVPPGYLLRTYQPGDEPGYYKLMALAGFPEWNDAYLTEWIGRILPEGWFMAMHEATGEIVATAMACYDHTDLHPFGGALGWVAGNPAHAGKGLGAAVSAAATTRLIAAGYRDIHLDTEDERLTALKIYLTLGYQPFLYSPAMKGRWQAVYDKLNWPSE